MPHYPIFGKPVYTIADIRIGTVLTYSNLGGQEVRVKVTDVVQNIKNERDGFSGYVVDADNNPVYSWGADDTVKDAYINVWGYTQQITDIHNG